MERSAAVSSAGAAGAASVRAEPQLALWHPHVLGDDCAGGEVPPCDCAGGEVPPRDCAGGEVPPRDRAGGEVPPCNMVKRMRCVAAAEAVGAAMPTAGMAGAVPAAAGVAGGVAGAALVPGRDPRRRAGAGGEAPASRSVELAMFVLRSGVPSWYAKPTVFISMAL